ncbi:PLP-dependent aminotransferase family protein [Candidatus Latescibacterota bacterium]
MSQIHYSSWASGLRKSDISEILEVGKEPGILSLAQGTPYPEAYPAEKVAEVISDLVSNNPEIIFPYGHPQGTLRSREAVAYRMKKRGIEVSSENIVMTAGSQNACDMVLRMFVEPGDTMIIEAPTFLGVLDSIRNWGLNLVDVPIDNDGIRTDILRDTLTRLKNEGVHPRAIYLMSNHHNPAGIMISTERKKELPLIAEEFDCFILEDDAYCELLYDDTDQTPVKGYDETGSVIYLGSFSKIVSPGFRVGWAAVPDELVRTWNICRPMFDVGSPALNQEIIAELHRDNWLDDHIKNLIKGYRSRRDTMLSALGEHMPEECSWTVPHGGFYSWVTTPEGIDHENLFRTAARKKVMYFMGKFFYLDYKHHNHFRLCFSRSDEDVIVEAVSRLASALREEMANI